MIKKITYLLCALTLVLSSSCSDDKTIYVPVEEPALYENGIIYYGTTYEDVSFYDPVKNKFYPGNIYEKINGGMIGTNEGYNGGINSVYIYDGKIYFLTPMTRGNGEYEGQARITVADAKTFRHIKHIYADGFDMASLGNIYGLTVVDENKFYITYNQYNGGANDCGMGILKVDPSTGATTFTKDVAGLVGHVGIDGPGTSNRTVRQGGWILICCGNAIKFIDAATDQVDETKTISFDARRQVTDILKAHDGYIYALVAGEADKEGDDMWAMDMPMLETESSIVKIDPVSFDIVYEEFLLDEEDEQIDILSGLGPNGAVASLTSNHIIFKTGVSWGQCGVYVYDLDDRSINHIFQAVPADGTCGKYMATDKKGNLYVPLATVAATSSTTSVKVFRIADGMRMTDIESVIGTSNGDGGLVSTYIF